MNDICILVVEDDAMMRRLLASHLKARGYDVVLACDGAEALQALQTRPIQLVLLDITLPGGLDGLEVCRRMRATSAVPIILVTAAQRPETKVTALDIGGDDYLTKPFNADELLARIRAVLRRAGDTDASPARIEAGDLTVDLAAREVRIGGRRLHLTKIEFDLLAVLVRQADRTLTYAQMLRVVWGPGYDDIRAVHTHISHLRRKIEGTPDSPRYLLAVPGVGYRFRPGD